VSEPIDHPFADPALLQEALTHTSWSHENGGPDYQRLEFLGDAVLQMVVTHWLVESLPTDQEGELTRLRQHLVNTRTLAEVGRALGLGAHLRLGVGEESTGGRDRDKTLAGACEAVLGAVYLDGGWPPAERLVKQWFADRFEALTQDGDARQPDPRGLLQAITQRDLGATPTYEVTSREGPPHAPTFAVEVRIGERVLGRGVGSSKRQASRQAASDALKQSRGSP
jgi:ribonuclease-3